MVSLKELHLRKMIQMPDFTPTKLKHALVFVNLAKLTDNMEMKNQHLREIERLLQQLESGIINDTFPNQNRPLPGVKEL